MDFILFYFIKMSFLISLTLIFLSGIQACQIETAPLALSAYVVFLSQFAPANDLNDLGVVSVVSSI